MTERKTIKIENLFYKERIDPAISKLQKFYLILYAPIGLILALLRAIAATIWVLFFVCLPANKHTKILFLKGTCCILGFIPKFKNDAQFDQNRNHKFIVTNHTYTLEALPLLTKHWCIITARRALIENWLVHLLHKFIDTKPAQILFSDANEIVKHKYPILVFAEGASTNGKVGLLKYNPLVFTHGEAILPVAIKLSRPLPIRFSKLHFSFFEDFLWALFTPWSIFEYTFLPLQTIKHGESPEEFADRVQQMTAAELGIAATQFTNKDKVLLRDQSNIMSE